MVARAHSRGWPIEWTGARWVYSDTHAPDDDSRACRRCGRKPTPEGYDACLGRIKGVAAACCGHGAGRAFVKNNSKG